jgi:hypothetical protein
MADFQNEGESCTTWPQTNCAPARALARIENAARRASGVLLTAPGRIATKDEMIAKEILETRDALSSSSYSKPLLHQRTIRLYTKGQFSGSATF